MFKSLTCIRIFDVSAANTTVLADVFGHLRHMRSLRILKYIDEFSNSSCKLHNLQVLDFYTNNFLILPENMKYLTSLRHSHLGTNVKNDAL